MSTLAALLFYALLAAVSVWAAWRFVAHYAPRETSALPLAVFRIAYGLVLFAEVAQLYVSRRLLTDPVPYVLDGELALGPALVAWMVAIVLLVVGFQTRAAALASYAFTLATLSGFERFEYHVDYVMTGVNLLLVIAPVSERLSVDRWLAARARRQQGLAEEGPRSVSRLYSELFILLGIALVYFDSVFYKLASPMWTAGLGVWLPASLPQVTWVDLTPLLDQRALMLGLGYLTLVFESVFLALMFFDRLRPALFAVGLGLHLGITMAFPIPWFGLAMMALYALLVPGEWMEAAARRLRRSETGAALPRAHARFSSAARLGFAAFTGWLLLSQSLATVQAPLVRQAAESVGLAAPWGRAASLASVYTQHVSRPVAGITRHGVFMDGHFRGYEQMISVALLGTEDWREWLPIYGEDGLATAANTGRNWVHWNWRVVGTEPDAERLAEGVRRYTAWWAHGQGRTLDDLRFALMVRDVEVPETWAKGHLRRQLERPWRELGRAGWSGGKFWVDLGGMQSASREASSR